MEYLISAVLGAAASWLQGDRTKHLSKNLRYFLSILACFTVGVIVVTFNSLSGGTFDLNELLASMGLAFTASQTYYNLYFKKD